mmetsp:Transcript_1394/g.3053  ORF Transcript_1394/g.3053 Transcript_1394/m.3053 type:complete len:3134 (-) Transcript_1394:67-9468(-)
MSMQTSHSFLIYFFVLLCMQIASSQDSNFLFNDNYWNIPTGSPGQCSGTDCQKYVCANKPEQPYCRGCSGNPSAYNIDPKDCLESDPTARCSTCLSSCAVYGTGWENYVPVAGVRSEPFHCQNSGDACAGSCYNSWHKSCSVSGINDCPAGDTCAGGEYVCFGEDQDDRKVCSIVTCDPNRATFDPNLCECKKGRCLWSPSPPVTRDMGTANSNQKCDIYNQDQTAMTTKLCSQCPRSIIDCPSCQVIGSDPTDCLTACLLDSDCKGVTWRPSSTNTTNSTCVKAKTDCVLKDSAFGESAYIKGATWNFPTECLPRLDVQEDIIRNPRLGFVHSNTTCQSCSNVEVLLNVKYGKLNFGLKDNSLKCIDPNYNPITDGNPPRINCRLFATGLDADFKLNCPSWPESVAGCNPVLASKVIPGISDSVRISFLPAWQAGSGQISIAYPGLSITGPYKEVLVVLRNLTYSPTDDQNSMRIRSRIYSGSTSLSATWPIGKPYEELVISVIFDKSNPNCSACGVSGTSSPHVRRYLMHILPMNDAPYMGNPVNTYKKPKYCKATVAEEDCIDSSTGLPLTLDQCHICYFAPFFTYEGSTTFVPVSGLTLIDDDAYESCTWANAKCTSADTKILVRNGGIDLNTRLGLSIYSESSSLKAFTAPMGPTVSAITVLQYQAYVQGVGNIYYNTQSNGNSEKISVAVSDQGFNGAVEANGALSNGISLESAIDIPLTIVAMNNAPVVSFGSVTTNYKVSEDVLSQISSITVKDSDVDEVVTSALAQKLWMSLSQYSNYLHKIQLLVTVTRGKLLYQETVNLNLLDVYESTYLTINPRFSGHDVCRTSPIYLNPAGETTQSSYQVSCSKSNIGQAGCLLGTESTCTCNLKDDCSTLSRVLLFLNRTSSTFTQYYSDFTYSVESMSDRTCGGVPWYSAPNAFTVGKVCQINQDCATTDMLPCNATGSCLCCADLNRTCTSHSDCNAAVFGSLCGCTWNGPASLRAANPGTCGPWLDSTNFLAADTDGNKKLTPTELAVFISSCTASTCLYRATTKPADCLTCVGLPCTYTGAGATSCLPPITVENGTTDATVIDPLTTVGSQRIQVYGAIADVNKAIASMQYLSNLNYNRLYRSPACYPPPREKTKLCAATVPNFDPTFDDIDTVTVEANDLGNSGGIERTIQIDVGSRNVLVQAVNDRPRISSPAEVQLIEDWVFSFLNPDLLGTAGLSLPAPDWYQNFLVSECVYDKTKSGTTFDPSLGSSCGCFRVCTTPTVQLSQVACSCTDTDCDLKCGDKQVATVASILRSNLIQPSYTYGRIGDPIILSDPDYRDFGFLEIQMELNISCNHGRLLLNEAFLSQRDVLGVRIKVQNYPGLGVQSSTSPGLYYTPVGSACNPCDLGWRWQNGLVVCCDVEPCRHCAMWGVGNRFISITGNLDDLNLALSNLTYINDLNFNTRYGQQEAILLQLNDNGAIGDSLASSPKLGTLAEIVVNIESVNDGPEILRQVPGLSESITLGDGETVVDLYRWENAALNASINYIDVDEDIVFVFNQSHLWIDDVDSQEAETISAKVKLTNKPITFTCFPGQDTLDLLLLGTSQCVQNAQKTGYVCQGGFKSGCSCTDVTDTSCSGGCSCTLGSCCIPTCPRPGVCPDAQGKIAKNPGELLVEFSVSNGMLSLYPPAGRSLLSLTFYSNLTATPVSEGGAATPCLQLSCMQNQSSIVVVGVLAEIQKIFSQRFLSYLGFPNYYGPDVLSVWVSDQGFTDQSFNDSLTASFLLPINVNPVNDPPTIQTPNEVLNYDMNQVCYVDFMLQYRDPQGLVCPQVSGSLIPDRAGAPPILFFDVDVRDVPQGNVTLTITIEAKQPGRIFFNQTLPRVSYLQFRNELDYTVLILKGKIDDINQQMLSMRFDAQTGFAGYAPLNVFISDNGNYGGEHCVEDTGVCRDFTFTCPTTSCPSTFTSVPDLCLLSSTRPCMQWLRTPNLPHFVYPNRARSSRSIIDLSVGAAASCQLNEAINESLRCVECAKLAGCNWCPSFCNGKGKCMIGKSSPTYEMCPQGAFRKYGQCSDTSGSSKIVPAVIATAVALAVLLICFLFLRWTQRRYGGLRKYLVRKQEDAARVIADLNLATPADARWMEFFFQLTLFVLLAVWSAGLFSQNSASYPAEFFLDVTSWLTLDLDYCSVRFLPARNFPEPEHSISFAKVRVSLSSDPLIVLNADICTQHTTLYVNNTKSEATRYQGYHCRFQIIVPEAFVLPRIEIKEHSSLAFPSSVRAGSMDVDTPNFGLRLGPNRFSLAGQNLFVRLHNFSSKTFDLNVDQGELVATDFSTADSATMQTVGANLVVTTSRMTTVRFFQPSENLVCLTAANKSLYVDGNCKKTCEYLTINSTSRRAWTNVSSSRRLLQTSTLNYTVPTFGPTEMCPDGVTLKKDVLYVPDCTDMTLCTQSQTEQCLCRPGCDMVPPAQLCINGVCGVAGTCDVLGRCCRTICSGYSLADLFPTPNQPRDGAAIDPVTMPWTPGGLEQQWTLYSQSGQISVSSLASPSQYSVSSYRGAAPSELVAVAVAVPAGTKDLLDKNFHPSGASRPHAKIFEFVLTGPGALDPEISSLVWIPKLMYLSLPSYVLDTLSLGILKPLRTTVSTALKPGFCPAFVASTSSEVFSARLVQVRQVLLDVLQTYPAYLPMRRIPSGSLLVYQLNGTAPQVFVKDPVTNKMTVLALDINQLVAFWSGVYFSLALSLFAAMVVCIVVARHVRRRIQEIREQLLLETQIFSCLSDLMRMKVDAASGLHKIIFDQKLFEEIEGYTGFVFLLEFFLGFDGLQASSFARASHFLQVATVLCLPVIPLWVLAEKWRQAYLSDLCRMRHDKEECLLQKETLSSIVSVVLVAYFAIAGVECTGHFLKFSRSAVKIFLRKCFYIAILFASIASTGLAMLVVLWIIIGVYWETPKALPYAIALTGFIANFFAIKLKHDTLRYRVELSLKTFLREEEAELSRVLPKPFVAIIIDKNLYSALRSEGLSTSQIIKTSLLRVLILLLLFVLLFAGFAAFTDTNSLTAGIINSAVVFVISVCFNNVSRPDSENEKDEILRKQEKIRNSIHSTVQLLKRQHQILMTLLSNSHIDKFAEKGEDRSEEYASDDSSRSSSNFSI